MVRTLPQVTSQCLFLLSFSRDWEVSSMSVHDAASHKFCINCRDIRVWRQREREMELEAGNAEDACMLGFARNSALLT